MCQGKFIVLLPLFFTLNLLGQVKQITFYDSDVKNANYVKTSFSSRDSLLFYEVHSGDSVNIHCRVYEVLTDSFYIFPPVTDDQYKNINPLVVEFYPYPIVFYQTNKNGNWDIVYRQRTLEGWTDPIELLATAEDEEEPQFVGRTWAVDTVYLVCRQGNKILLLRFKDGLVSQETVFSGDQFGQNNFYSGFYSPLWPTTFRIATTEQTSYGSRLVYKYTASDTGWTPPIVVSDSGNFAHPLFMGYNYDPYLFYEKEVNGNRQIFYKTSDNGDEQTLQPEITGNKSELDVNPYAAITNDLSDDYLGELVYKLEKDDSLFIRDPINGYEFETHPIKTINPDPVTAPFAILIPNLVYYSVWEDSINGTIQLFGKRFLVSVGGVNDYSSAEGYALSQNYPNPFNPATRIRYIVPSGSQVSLKVYDVLGNEIKTLVNEFQNAGEHQLSFNGVGLASGIYIIRLNSAGLSLSRKMVYIK